MIVRKIRPEDYKRIHQLCALCFEYTWDDAGKTSEELFNEMQENPTSRTHQYWDHRWAAFEDDDQTMMSSFIAIPYQVNFDGHTVGMGGIGGVTTLPEYRKRGGVRACFEKALPDMYAQGMAFSYLYPFSTAFYRKFGYELGCERTLYKIKLLRTPDYKIDGSFHLLEPGKELLPDIQQVYDTLQKRYNMMTIEEEYEYAWVQKANPFRDKEYTYVYRSADGTPKAVVTYVPSKEEGDRELSHPTLDCTKRFWFVDIEGFQALIHLLKRLSADHSHILFNLPADIELGALMPEWSFTSITREKFEMGMVRVINVEQVLKMAKTRGNGELVIEVTDAQIKQNNGRFKVTFSDGYENKVERTNEDADIRLTIQDFSRLICGRYDVNQFRWMPDVQLLCDEEKAAKVFYLKPMFITRYF